MCILHCELCIKKMDKLKMQSENLVDSNIDKIAAEFPSKIGAKFIGWFTSSNESIDGKSKQKAYNLYDEGFIDLFLLL